MILQSASLISSSSLLPCPFSSWNPSSNGRKASSTLRIMASQRGAADRNFGGRLVDENMIVLRKRIQEMKMMERNFELPSDWMEWEKRCYANYDSVICEAMGVIQRKLMNTRPSLALGMVALVAISVPTSSAVVLYHLVEISKDILAAIH